MSHNELADIFEKNVKVSWVVKTLETEVHLVIYPFEWKCDFYEIEIFYELKVYDQM